VRRSGKMRCTSRKAHARMAAMPHE